MRFRVARHSSDLEALEKFYCDILQMEVIGRFEQHDEYDGIFFAFSNTDWHLEFTKSKQAAKHHFDEDDLLVIYYNSKEALSEATVRMIAADTPTFVPRNPYWRRNGYCFRDPDGFRVVLAISTQP